MLDRKLETEQLPYCSRHSVSVLAYSPLALGLLTGQVPADRTFNEGDMRRTHRRFTVENRTKVAALLDRFNALATSRRCTIGQLVIAWTLAQQGVTHALVGARDAAQLEENAAGGEVELSPGEVEAMNAAVRELTPGIV